MMRVSMSIWIAVACMALVGNVRAEETTHFWTVREVMEKNPLKEGEAAKWTPLINPLNASLMMIQGDKQVPMHYHASHDEVVMVVEGTGTFTVGSEQKKIGPHSILHIPKGIPHGGIFEGRFAAVIVYTPEFDLGKPDRVRVDSSK